ncbi:hypothetical protein HUJ05_012353 [Dendroctonus ponderosae]|nr:hypothetical protein HUJ05_012328 [Dendroctonus ponderosae]KAH1014497.1 hypothetical protein HUJ05_012353 [Dendroctonus ponderosae]
MELKSIYIFGLLSHLITQSATWPFSPEVETIAIYSPLDNKKYVPLSAKLIDSSAPVDDSLATKKDLKRKDVVVAQSSSISQPQSHFEEANHPSGILKLEPANYHRISKRQTRRFPFYRPVARFSGFSSSRRRVDGFFRRPGLVGYLNDRDYFPTVA